jgi:hypothetical protein
LLANAFDNRGGGTWSRKGVIVFSPAPLGPLQQVSETGGAVSPATWLDRSQQDLVHLWPQFANFAPWGETPAGLNMNKPGSIAFRSAKYISLTPPGLVTCRRLDGNKIPEHIPASGGNLAFQIGHVIARSASS